MQTIHNINELKVGDKVKSIVFTWSQKWMVPGYEEYNMTKIGFILKIGTTFYDTYIIDEEHNEKVLAVDPGSSGGVSIDKYK